MSVGQEIYQKLAEHGTTVRALGIPNETTHQGRLKIAAQMINAQRTSAILDFGCGFGDLWPWLRTDIVYTGMDSRPEMLNEARRRYPGDPGVFKTAAQISGLTFETVAALGVLVTVRPNELTDFMTRTLGRLAAKRLVVSWIPTLRGAKAYKGVFNTHRMSDFIEGWNCVFEKETTGEVTALLERKR
jgi:trans-aconitate methyltransferase